MAGYGPASCVVVIAVCALGGRFVLPSSWGQACADAVGRLFFADPSAAKCAGCDFPEAREEDVESDTDRAARDEARAEALLTARLAALPTWRRVLADAAIGRADLPVFFVTGAGAFLLVGYGIRGCCRRRHPAAHRPSAGRRSAAGSAVPAW